MSEPHTQYDQKQPYYNHAQIIHISGLLDPTQPVNRQTGANTQYHPAGSCVMMPPAFGGVVSPELLVHGTSNLRGSQMMLSRRAQVLMPSTGVVDASIIPMLPAAHLQAVVYGIAEKVCLADFSDDILS